jgi:hypothetical protein
MKNISLVFQDDVQRNDLETLKTVKGCLGVSAYKNTVNLYFRRIDRVTLVSLALVAQRILAMNATALSLTAGEFSSESSSRELYAALREEATG